MVQRGKTTRNFWSGRQDSNPRPSPWQGNANRPVGPSHAVDVPLRPQDCPRSPANPPDTTLWWSALLARGAALRPALRLKTEVTKHGYALRIHPLTFRQPGVLGAWSSFPHGSGRTASGRPVLLVLSSGAALESIGFPILAITRIPTRNRSWPAPPPASRIAPHWRLCASAPRPSQP
jgi:hypothetical protein